MQLVTSKVNSPRLNPTLLGNNFFEDIQKIQSQRTFTKFQNISGFHAEFTFGEFFFYSQKFSFTQKNDYLIFRSQPINSFPTIEIVLKRKNSKVKIEDFKIERSDNSVQGELLYTRIYLLLAELRKVSLNIKTIGLPLDFSFSELGTEVKSYMLFRAKLARKLKFIEDFFNTKFYLPEEFESEEIRKLEILYRGITEGEFSMPFDSSITVYNYKLTEADLFKNSTTQRKEFSFEFNEDFLFLGKSFPVGKMIFKIKKGSIANPRVLKNFSEGEVISKLNFNVFDYQAYHKFVKYSDSKRLIRNRQKLDRFKANLRKEEPDFLVNLIDDYLSKEIDNQVAIEIVEGLLQYYDFPDRYSVLSPELKKHCWKVPIALTYPDHKPIILTDAFVNVKTGKVEMEMSFDELLKKGKKKAKEVFAIA